MTTIQVTRRDANRLWLLHFSHQQIERIRRRFDLSYGDAMRACLWLS